MLNQTLIMRLSFDGLLSRDCNKLNNWQFKAMDFDDETQAFLKRRKLYLAHCYLTEQCARYGLLSVE